MKRIKRITLEKENRIVYLSDRVKIVRVALATFRRSKWRALIETCLEEGGRSHTIAYKETIIKE